MARTYLLRAGELHWQQINPDIFGSMIQAVAEDEERGSLGMHYTSVPNILKVLNPLFLDDLRAELEAAGDSLRKLRALRRRIATIRVFDPACGSGNFLVIAYIQLREIEREIGERTGDEAKSAIPLTNFYGIEIKSFAAEIARLALLIAEFQCDSRMISQQAARSMVLPLHKTGQVHIGNALRMNWMEVCPLAAPVHEEWDLGGPTGRLAFEESDAAATARTETYICGNPPYRGSKWQDEKQKSDLRCAWINYPHLCKTTDYVTGWLAKAQSYALNSPACIFAFVMTNSVVQGQQAGDLWSPIFSSGLAIKFAYQSFPWRNLAANNAGVTVVVVGVTRQPLSECQLFQDDKVRLVKSIGCYLVAEQTTIVAPRSAPSCNLPEMVFGNMPRDGGHLIISSFEETRALSIPDLYIKRYIGSQELIDGVPRYCLWIGDDQIAMQWRARR